MAGGFESEQVALLLRNTHSSVLDMKITRISASKKRRIRPKLKIDFRAFDFTEFAVFLRKHANEWLNSRRPPGPNREAGERLDRTFACRHRIRSRVKATALCHCRRPR